MLQGAPNKSRVFRSQPEYDWLTRPRLYCHIWKLITQLGQPQPAFANQKESSVGRVVRHVCDVPDVAWLTGVVFIRWLVGVTSDLTNRTLITNETTSRAKTFY